MRRRCVSCVFVLALVACVEPPERSAEKQGPSLTASTEQTIDAKVEAAPPAKAQLPPAPAPAPALTPARGGFELLEAGTGSLARLRFAPLAEQVEELSVSMAMSVSLSGAGIPPMAQRMPAIEQRSRIQVDAFDAEQIETTVVFEGISLATNSSSPDQAAALQASSAALVGFEQARSFARRGGLDQSLSAPTNADPKLASSLETLGTHLSTLFVTLPEQDVGVGAKWKHSARFETKSLPVERTTQVELVTRAGDRVTLELNISERALVTSFQREDMPGEVEVVSFDSRGRGRVTYELDKLVPVSAQVKMDTKLSFALAADDPGEAKREVQTSLSLELNIPALERP